MNKIKTVDKSAIKHLSTYGLALFLFLTPFEYPLADLVSVSPLRIIGIATMGLAVLDIFRQKNNFINYRTSSVFFWLVWGITSFLWAIDETRFLSYYSIYFNNALMFLIISLVRYKKEEIELFKKSMIGGVAALLFYMTFVPGATIYSEYQHRLTLNAGTEGLDQNYLAALMLMAFGIVFYKMCNDPQKKIYKVLSLIFCVAIVYYTILTGSRSGLLSLALIVILSVNTSWKTRFYIGIPIILSLLVIFPLLSRIIPEELLDRFSLSAFTGNEDESEVRLLIWENAIKYWKNFKWVLGSGVGASQTVIGASFGRDAAIHNHYIAMITEIGVIGLGFILHPMVKMIRFLWKNKDGVAIAFCGIVVMTFFIDVVTTKFFWAAMMLLSACCSNSEMLISEKNK